MDIREEKRGKVKIVGLRGRLDANSSQGVENQLLALMNQGEDRLVLDFSELTYMSSLGLRVLMMVAKNIKQVNGKLALSGLNDHIYEIFKIARFTNIFSIYPNCDEAVAYCAD
jgi:anti-anti-sigma factor